MSENTRAHGAVLATGLVCLLACTFGCTSGGGDEAADFEIRFEAVTNGAVFSCSGETGDIAVTDARLFVHGFEMIGPDGARTPASIAPDKRFAVDGVALLDFEDGSGRCKNGSPTTNTRVKLSVPEGDYSGLAFRVGVPFELNHANPAKAKSPLSLTSMHWSWQAGYKFLRLSAAGADGTPHRVHLGSTGCNGTIGDISGCDAPNIATVELGAFDPGSNRVGIDLDALLAGAKSAKTICMGNYDEPGCAEAFAALSLAKNGQPAGPATAFSTR